MFIILLKNKESGFTGLFVKDKQTEISYKTYSASRDNFFTNFDQSLIRPSP